MTRKHTNNRMQEEQFNCRQKQQPTPEKKHKEKAKWESNMTKDLEGLKEGQKAEIHIDLFKTTHKNIELENARSWWNTWFLNSRNSPSFTTH